MTQPDPQGILVDVFFAETGLYALLWPAAAQARFEARNQRHMDERIRRGSDACLEEPRSLQSYAPKIGLPRHGIVDGLAIALGFIFIFPELYFA